MWKQMTYKQKNRWLLGLIALTAVLVYVLALQKTGTLYQENSAMEARVATAEHLPDKIRFYEKELSAFSNSHFLQQGSGASAEGLLRQISRFCQDHQLLLKAFPAEQLHEKAGYTVATNEILVQGQYADMLRLLYLLETEQQAGRIASVQFSAQLNRQSKRRELTARIYLQNLKSRTDEG